MKSLTMASRLILFFGLSIFLHIGGFLFLFASLKVHEFIPDYSLKVDLINPAPLSASRVTSVVSSLVTSVISPEPSSASQPLIESAQQTVSTAMTSATATEINQYAMKIVELLNRNKIYPQEAIAHKQEGRVVLEVTLAADGLLKEVELKEASTFESLNKAALATIQRIARFPPPPQSSDREFHFTAPIQFKISRH